MNSRRKQLVVIPAFNEEAALPGTVESLKILPPEEFEILIVNDGSFDGTGKVAESLAQHAGLKTHVVHLAANCGIGVAVQTGYRFARFSNEYHYVIQFDADGQHDAEAIPELVAESDRSQLDLCVGSRFLNTDTGGYRSTFLRRMGIRVLTRLFSLLTGSHVTDPTSGLRCAGPNAWRRFAEVYGEDYPEPESLYWCLRNGLRYGEIPVCMQERSAGESSIRTLDGVYYMLKVILAILVERLRHPKRYAQ